MKHSPVKEICGEVLFRSHFSRCDIPKTCKKSKMLISGFLKNVISDPSRPQIGLMFAISETSQCWRAIRIASRTVFATYGAVGRCDTSKTHKILEKKWFIISENCVSEPRRFLIELKIVVSESSRCHRPVWTACPPLRKSPLQKSSNK